MSERLVKISRMDGVGVVFLDRPAALNALNPELFEQLHQALADLDADPDIECMIMTSDGKAFCVGADIKYMAETRASADQIIAYLSNFDRVAGTNKPLIACVNGAALGGGFELALACDMILASSRAFFSFPEIELGLIPGGGGTQRLTRSVGKQRAMEMIMTNKRFSSKEGRAVGFVNEVFEPNVLLDEGIKLARAIGAHSSSSIAAAKKAILTSEQTSLEVGLAEEKKLFADLLIGEDGKEGVRAFIEKRPPNWKK